MSDISNYTHPDLHKAYDAYLNDLRKKNLADNTIAAYQSDLIGFFRFLMQHQGKKHALLDLNALKMRDFRSFLAHKKFANNNNASLARHLSAVRSFFAWLAQKNLTTNAAIEMMTAPKKTKKIPRPVRISDIEKILNEAMKYSQKTDWQNIRDTALFMLLYGSGLRISEALGLDAKAVKQADDTLRVMGKGKKVRLVPLLPVVKTMLLQAIEACPYATDNHSALFYGAKGGKMSPRIAQLRIAEVRKILQLPESLTPHALRHSFASHLLNQGANLREIQELLGHQSIKATQIYTKIETDDIIKEYHDAHPRT